MPKALCLGEMLFDKLALQVGVSCEEVTAWTAYPGGAPANVACALTKLGTTAGFVGAIGEDDNGRALLRLLQTSGVDTRGVQTIPHAPTREVFVTRTATGDREFARFSGEPGTVYADMLLSGEALPLALFEEAEVLVLGTLGLASETSRRAISRALDLAERYYLRVVVDVNWRPIFWPQPDMAATQILAMLQRADFVKLAKEEAEWLFQTADPAAIADRLSHLEGVLVTNGANSCRYYLGERTGERPAFVLSALDTTGAGDAFVAGFVHQLCRHSLADFNDPQTADEIVAYACAVAGLTTTSLGAIAAQPDAAKVDLFLQERLRR